MILISTLPVKGEESLDLQSPLTTSPNLDNCISTAPAEQRLDDDDRHGYLTGSCGRHAKRRGTAAIQVCSCHHLHPAPTGCPFESGCMVLLLHQGRSSLFTLLSFTCSSLFLVVPLTLLLSCKLIRSTQLHSLSSRTVMHTSTSMYLVVLSPTCCSIPTCRLGSGLTRTWSTPSVAR
jgi:hypothetical protein